MQVCVNMRHSLTLRLTRIQMTCNIGILLLTFTDDRCGSEAGFLPISTACSVMPYCGHCHPRDMLILDVLMRAVPRKER